MAGTKRLLGQNPLTDLLREVAPKNGDGKPLVDIDGVVPTTGVPALGINEHDWRWFPSDVNWGLAPEHRIGRTGDRDNIDEQDYNRTPDNYYINHPLRETGTAPLPGSGWTGFAYDLGPLGNGPDGLKAYDVLFNSAGLFAADGGERGHLTGTLIGFGCEGAAFDPEAVYLWVGELPEVAGASGFQDSTFEDEKAMVPGWAGRARVITPNGDHLLGVTGPRNNFARLYITEQGVSASSENNSVGQAGLFDFARITETIPEGTWMQVWRYVAQAVPMAWVEDYGRQPEWWVAVQSWPGMGMVEDTVYTTDPWEGEEPEEPEPVDLPRRRRRWTQRDDEGGRWAGPNGPTSVDRSPRWGGPGSYV